MKAAAEPSNKAPHKPGTGVVHPRKFGSMFIATREGKEITSFRKVRWGLVLSHVQMVACMFVNIASVLIPMLNVRSVILAARVPERRPASDSRRGALL